MTMSQRRGRGWFLPTRGVDRLEGSYFPLRATLQRILPSMTRLPASLIAAAALFLGGYITPQSSAAPAPSPAPGPHSALIDVTLPAGTTAASGSDPEIEIWNVTTPYDVTVQSLRSQLPIFHDYKGMPWCYQSIGTKRTGWLWADARNSISVDVTVESTVEITRGPDEQGREACT